MKMDEMKFKFEMAKERWGERWNDCRDFFVLRWLRFRDGRRKRNPELVELDTFRRIVELEEKIRCYPNAVPLLTELMNAYKATGQEEKRLDVMRRLRDIDPLVMPEPAAPTPESEVDDALYAKALALVQSGVKAKAAILNRHLGCGYNEAAKICDALVFRDVVDPETRDMVK